MPEQSSDINSPFVLINHADHCGDDVAMDNDPAGQLGASHQEVMMEQPSESEESTSDSDSEDNLDFEDPDSDLHNLDHKPLALFHSNFFAQGMCEWLTNIEYRVPVQDRLASKYPRKVDPDVDKPKDYGLVCPLYLKDPEGNQSCLGDPLRTINDVILHSMRIHHMPPYCPFCHEPFDSCSLRDTHTRARACELGKYDVPLGYDERQRREIREHDKETIPDAQRWMKIYRKVFEPPEGDFPIKMAYLSDDLGLMITKIYDYINVFLHTNLDKKTMERPYLRFIWRELKATGWLSAFIRHYLDHVQTQVEATSLPENEAMRISHCLNIWLREIFPRNGAYRRLEFSDLYPMSTSAYTPHTHHVDRQQSRCNFCDTSSYISSDLPTAHNLCRKRQGDALEEGLLKRRKTNTRVQ